VDCDNVRVHLPEDNGRAEGVFGSVSRPPPALAAIGLVPVVGGGYAPAAFSSIAWEGRVYTSSARALDAVVDTIDVTRLSPDAQRALARGLSNVAGCFASRLEEHVQSRLAEEKIGGLARPRWEPKLAAPAKTLVITPRGVVEASAPYGAWLPIVLWLYWVGRALRECMGPECPGPALLHAGVSVYADVLEDFEERIRERLILHASLIPLYAVGGGRVDRAAVPGEGVSMAEYAAKAAAMGVDLLVPPPPPKPADRLALVLAALSLTRPL